MRAIQNGTTIVRWSNDHTPDSSGTGIFAPGGTLTDILTAGTVSTDPHTLAEHRAMYDYIRGLV
jgi:hypothetical protein